MEVFVHINNDYEFLLPHDDAVLLKNSPLESVVMSEGEIPTHVIGVIRIDESQKEKITFGFDPKNAGWDDIKRAIFTLNLHGYKQVLDDGGILLGGLSRDIYVRDPMMAGNVNA